MFHRYLPDYMRDAVLLTDGGGMGIERIPLDENSLISINVSIYLSPSQTYAKIEPELNPDQATDTELANAVIETRYDIPRVRELTRTLVEDFPKSENPVTQSAYWERAVAGLHMFKDANHRTGLRSLREMMLANGIEMYGDPLNDELRAKNERVIEKSTRARERMRWTEREKIGEERGIYEKDELFWIWYSYFSDVL